MSSKKIILVTGGTGLVGTAIKNISNKPNGTYKKNMKYVFASSKDCDLTNYEKTKQYFQTIKPNYVIHLAANVGGLYKNMNQKVEMYEKNILINLNVLKCCHEHNIEKCVSILSTCIFPDKVTYPINEKMLHDGPPHTSNDAYAYAKRMLHVHSKIYNNQYNTKFACVIPTNVYGPNDNYNLDDSHVIPALIHKCYLAKQNDTDFVVFGDGTPLRQFIYSEDLAELILWYLLDVDDVEPIILAPHESYECSIKEIANIIGSKFNKIPIFDTTKSNGQYKKTADISRFQKLYMKNKGKYYKYMSIQEGLDKAISWFVENYETCRK